MKKPIAIVALALVLVSGVAAISIARAEDERWQPARPASDTTRIDPLPNLRHSGFEVFRAEAR